MTPLEHIRLAAALTHSVPGAHLRLGTGTGESVVVGRNHGADMDPCAFRRLIAAGSGRRLRSDADAHFRMVDSVVVGGTLLDIGGGVYASRVGEQDQRWIASRLAHRRVADLLADVEGCDDSIHACLRPDDDLGVTVLEITDRGSDARPACGGRLDAVAARAAAACFVAELIDPDGSMVTTDDRRGGDS